MDTRPVDEIDARILGVLVNAGRSSWRELGELVGLSPTAAAERVRTLERRGVIRGYRAEVDSAALGLGLSAIVDVELTPTMAPDDFESRLANRSEVSFAAYVTGRDDYTIMVDCAGPEGLDTFVRWLKQHAGAASTETKLVLRTVDLTPGPGAATRWGRTG